MPSFFQLGDRSVEIQLGSLSIEKHIGLRNFILESDMDGVEEVVATKSSVCIFFSSFKYSIQALNDIVEKFIHIEIKSGQVNDELTVIPACYDKKFGIDLAIISKLTNMSEAEIIKIHSSTVFKVSMFGFVPGFPYMDGLPASLRLERKKKPSIVVPHGSIGIVADQCGIYPVDVPGGWYILARTPMKLINWNNKVPVRLVLGQKVRFEPISDSEFNSQV